MVTKSVPVNVHLEYAYCECGEELIQSNCVLTTNPPKYKYVCPTCLKEEYLVDVYPKITYKEKRN